MSCNKNDTIGLHNYEEWFVLYMDNELSAEQKVSVDHFLLLHPHLQEELDLLMGTRLPVDEVVFSSKEELLSASMKRIVIDESLLCYIDNELPPAEKASIEEKIKEDKDLYLLHQLLAKTKLDAAEVIPYPDKTELYRYTEKATPLFALWMRIAVAVVILFSTAYFFLADKKSVSVVPDAGLAVTHPSQEPVAPKGPSSKKVKEFVLPQPSTFTAKSKTETNMLTAEKGKNLIPTEIVQQKVTTIQKEVTLPTSKKIEATAIAKVAPVKTATSVLTAEQTVALNKIVANPTVTSADVAAYNSIENPEEPAVTEGEQRSKKSSAKGFLRKVSRFIERRTGIGTVNVDNEILVGSLALKLN